ncbi:hypothetical protein GGI23_002757 [Coemansia sp. RSA 2559]|nr:hypothetical protein GGI23_002757 [Coemansia sp. RSA 2559]
MDEGPKRFSLSDYQSKRGPAKPAESTVPQEQRNELEELHMLLGTGNGSNVILGNDDISKDVLRTPGASPVHKDRANDNANGEKDNGEAKPDRHSGRHGDKRSSKESRSKRHSSSRRHRHSHRRRSRSPRSKSRSRSQTRRKRARSASRSRSTSRSKSRSRSRSRSREGRSRRNGRSHRTERRRSSNRHQSRSRSRSQSKDKVSMRCVFPYEDGGIIIGLRGAHLTKLRRAVPTVDWRISNETNDRQDRIMVVKGTVDDVAEVCIGITG